MTVDEMKIVQANFAAMASIYGRPPYTDVALKFIAKALSNETLCDVLAAFEKYARDSKNKTPPTPAQILDLIHPMLNAKEDARYLAGSIMGCIAKHGYSWSMGVYVGGEMKFSGKGRLFASFQDALKMELGEVGAHVVNMLGGWSVVCERERAEGTSTLQAQIRDLCESTLLKAKNGTLNSLPSLDGSTKKPDAIAERTQALISQIKKEDSE